jgi:plasmid stabilization system protein ParE
MTERNTVVRSLHDLGLAAWFGGSLMGAIGLNGAAAAVSEKSDRARIASVGWARWTPVNAAAIGAHLAGATALLLGNKGRVAGQAGVGTNSAVKAGLLGASLAATAYARALGKKVEKAGQVPADGPTDPDAGTPADTAKAMRQEKLAQWAIPALTGGMVVLNALHGEQQRPNQVLAGTVRRVKDLLPFAS